MMLNSTTKETLDWIIKNARLREPVNCVAENREQVINYLNRNSNKKWSVYWDGMKGFRIVRRKK